MTEPTTIALTIHITTPNAGDATNRAQSIIDHITAEHGNTMRLRMAIHQPGYTPPPPSSDRDALPDELRLMIAPHMRPYVSTACETALALDRASAIHHPQMATLTDWEQRQHAACRITRKQDMARCQCDCHSAAKES